MSAAGHHDARARFSRASVVSDYERLYEDALAG
jgi:hypothetical protein